VIAAGIDRIYRIFRIEDSVLTPGHFYKRSGLTVKAVAAKKAKGAKRARFLPSLPLLPFLQPFASSLDPLNMSKCPGIRIQS
jgi:hypothetical protein